MPQQKSVFQPRFALVIVHPTRMLSSFLLCCLSLVSRRECLLRTSCWPTSRPLSLNPNESCFRCVMFNVKTVEILSFTCFSAGTARNATIPGDSPVFSHHTHSPQLSVRSVLEHFKALENAADKNPIIVICKLIGAISFRNAFGVCSVRLCVFFSSLSPLVRDSFQRFKR